MWLMSSLIPFFDNEIVKPVLNTLISYLLATEVLRRMINGSKSSLKMEYSVEDKESLDTWDMIKVYWSFYWRESLIGTGILLVMGLMLFLILRGGIFFSIVPILIIMFLIVLVTTYYVGRYVFMKVIHSVWWGVGRIEVELQE